MLWTSCSLVFDGAGNLISGGTGFGDSPPPYTGKQEWPELVGENAALAKAELVAETHLEVQTAPSQPCLHSAPWRVSQHRQYRMM